MNETPTLHFFCGKAGAGKSTLASRLANDHGLVMVSEDVCLQQLYADEMKSFDDYIRFSRRLKAVIGPLTVDLLRSGRSVVLDFQANTKPVRGWFRSLFEQASAGHVLHFIDVPDTVCLERIARRNVERPPGSHPLTEEDFARISSFFQPPDEAEGFDVVRYTA